MNNSSVPQKLVLCNKSHKDYIDTEYRENMFGWVSRSATTCECGVWWMQLGGVLCVCNYAV